MKVVFDGFYIAPNGVSVSMEMELEPKIKSIFDENIAGDYATNGEYYVILSNHKTNGVYALTREAFEEALSLGRKLELDGEEAIFNGERVRAMTFGEECLYNEDNLYAKVDLWGNISM